MQFVSPKRAGKHISRENRPGGGGEGVGAMDWRVGGVGGGTVGGGVGAVKSLGHVSHRGPPSPLARIHFDVAPQYPHSPWQEAGSSENEEHDPPKEIDFSIPGTVMSGTVTNPYSFFLT